MRYMTEIKTQQAFEIIKAYKKEKGVAPTISYLASALQEEKYSAKRYLKLLKEHGYISPERYSPNTEILKDMNQKSAHASNDVMVTDLPLSKGESSLLHCISASSHNTTVSTSLAQLAVQTGLSILTVRNYLSRLKAYGYISYKRVENLTIHVVRLSSGNNFNACKNESPGVMDFAEAISKFLITKKRNGSNVYSSIYLSKELGIPLNSVKYAISWLTKKGYIAVKLKQKPLEVISPFYKDEFISKNMDELTCSNSYVHNMKGLPRYSMEKIQLVYTFINEYIEEHGYAPHLREISDGACLPLGCLGSIIKWLVDNSYITRIYRKPRTYTILRPFNANEWISQHKQNSKQSTDPDEALLLQKSKLKSLC